VNAPAGEHFGGLSKVRAANGIDGQRYKKRARIIVEGNAEVYWLVSACRGNFA
jgi:hypothetical protein